MESLHTIFRLSILLLALTCSMGVTAQTSKAAQNNGLPVSLPSTNKGDTITEREFTSKVYDVVDEHPHFPGGNGALLDWLSKNIHYTSGCASIQGRVVVSFYVEKDGTISDVNVERPCIKEDGTSVTVIVEQSAWSALDKEIVRAVKAMPKWIPAIHNNKPIRAKYTLPITFRTE